MLKSFLKTQALDNLFCCLHTGSRALLYPQWRIQGRGPGASPPPPLNFRPNGGAKGGKNFGGETGSPLICLDPALTLLDFGVVMKDSA